MLRARVNEQILASQLHLISEKSESLGVVSRDQALMLAYEKGTDLVEIAPNVNPPVAKLIDYGKYLYIQQKKQRKAKSNQKESQLKEIRLSLKIDEHDFQTKVNQAAKFLEQGHKVRAFMILRGREKTFRDDAKQKLNQFAQAAHAKLAGPPKILGRTVSVILLK